MTETDKPVPELEFSRKYTAQHADRYFEKHRTGLGRRLSNWREQAIARQALKIAGDPAAVLDLPSGTGRFWEVLAEQPERKIIAADNSIDMIRVGLEHRPQVLTARIESFQCSAFTIPRPDNFVDCVFCMRLFHHVGEPGQRLQMLREFARVSSGTVIVSLWIDGNFKALRRRRHERRRNRHKYQNRFVIPRRVIEQEFADAGLEIVGRVDFLRFYSMWAVYVLATRDGKGG